LIDNKDNVGGFTKD